MANVVIMQDIINGRCGWCGTDRLYVEYHDREWGKLVTDDKTLFEFLVLEKMCIRDRAAQVLLSGQCAVPEKLTAAGFTFDAENIERFLERSAPLGK